MDGELVRVKHYRAGSLKRANSEERFNKIIIFNNIILFNLINIKEIKHLIMRIYLINSN